jgi:rod shape-determining protein MreC
MNLDEISRTEKVKAGDLVLTSNYSSIFPPYQPIGKVKKVNTNTSSQFSEIEVELSTNFNKLNTVYCVSTRFKNEMDSLHNSPLISPVSGKSDKN